MTLLPEYPPRIASASNIAAAKKFVQKQKQYRSCFSNGSDAQEEDKRNNSKKALPK